MGLMPRPGDFDQASPGQLIHEGTGAFPGEELALAAPKDQGWTLHRGQVRPGSGRNAEPARVKGESIATIGLTADRVFCDGGSQGLRGFGSRRKEAKRRTASARVA